LVGFSLFSATGLPVSLIVFGAVAAAVLENLASFGLDNLLVPVFIGLLLTRL
jgi:dolichol kinase